MSNENEFHLLARRTLRNTALFLVIFAILWAVLTEWRSIFAGLTFGAVVSLYFVVSAMRQTEMVAAIALQKVKKRPSIMMANRMAVIVGAVLLANVLEPRIGYVSLPSMLVGMFTHQFVFLLGFLYNKILSSIR